ncbi:hypothetical protein [Saccharothrix sp. HUAS TT1]|uniref:hypothetical protein n=1 Tax=unclassified Saccharothrix TaxID=2593673 RepID=UPI00345B6C7C
MDAPRTTPSPTGDPKLDRLLPFAGRLVHAAHHDSRLYMETALADAVDVYGDETTALRALVVLLAAMCPDDATPVELLSWRANATEYRRLRALDVPAAQARVLAARVSERLADRDRRATA